MTTNGQGNCAGVDNMGNEMMILKAFNAASIVMTEIRYVKIVHMPFFREQLLWGTDLP